MEFDWVIKHRKMVRSFLTKKVESEKIKTIVRNIFRGPSAGFAQGIEILVLRSEENKEVFFQQWGDKKNRKQYRQKWPNIENADTIIIFLSDEKRYRERYAKPDKTGKPPKEQKWRIPWWYVDTGMAALLGLLTTVDLELASAFTRIGDPNYIKSKFNIPSHLDPMGAILIGYPTSSYRQSKSAKKGRRDMDEVVHFGSYE